MARSGTFSRDSTKTAYFRSIKDVVNFAAPSASTGIGTPSDGDEAKGFRVRSDIANTTNLIVYANGRIVDTLPPGGVGEYVEVASGATTALGRRLELEAASGTVVGQFGTLD